MLLARDEAGYRNLIRLSSRAYLEGFYYKPRIDRALMRRHSEGLIALSACLKGEINERSPPAARRTPRRWPWSTGRSSARATSTSSCKTTASPLQRDANEVLRRISRRTGIPLVVTNDCHYLRQDDSFAHDVLLCIGTQRALADTDRLRYASDQFYLKSGEEIATLFPHDRAAMENTLAIAEACNL